MNAVSPEFEYILSRLSEINLRRYEHKLLTNAHHNLPHCNRTIQDISLAQCKKEQAIIISAGPSLHRQQSIKKIKNSAFAGSIIAVDAAYIACLREGLIPDFMISLDPHPTRMVRWFGDPNLFENSKNDDYFKRQDLDIEFRKNTEKTNTNNIEMVNQYGCLTAAIISSSIPSNVLSRLQEAKMDLFWWNPLVDDPNTEHSLTKKIYDINHLPALNTGGNVGTAAWVFATASLNISTIALVGMDMGYYKDTPFELTQTYPQLVSYNESSHDLEKYFIDFEFPLTKENFYTDVTYYWYRKNFLELLEQANNHTINCTEGGILFNEKLPCMSLDAFLNG